MDRQPVLEGEWLLLRPLTSADWDGLWAVACDRELWALHPSHDRWQEPVFRAFFADALAQGGALTIVDKRSGKIVGSSRFQDYEPADGGSIEIGWTFIARRLWGSGLNAELKRLMLEHAFGCVERALFKVGADNVVSRKAMTKIGGWLTGERWFEERAGLPVEHVMFEITRECFASGPLAPGAATS